MALPLEGIDYAWGRPGGAAIKAAGKHFVVRYVPYNNVTKGLTRAELFDLTTHGLSVAMVMEVFAGDALLGWEKGVEHGKVALQGMRNVGLPDSVPIYFAVDVDAQTHDQLLAVDNYLRGAGTIVGRTRVGVYGGIKVIEHCAFTRTASWFWQTYAWSYGARSIHNHLLQYDNYGNYINGVPVDLDRALKADFGQFPRPSTSPGIPDTATKSPDERMFEKWVPRILPTTGTMTVPSSAWVYDHPFIGQTAFQAKKATNVTVTGRVSGDEIGGKSRWFIYARNSGGLALVPEVNATNIKVDI